MRAGGWWWLASAALWVLSLSSKETAAVLPLVLICYDAWLMDGDHAARRRRVLRFYLPMALLVLGLNLRTVAREVRQLKVAMPKRVEEDEAELHPAPPPQPVGAYQERVSPCFRTQMSSRLRPKRRASARRRWGGSSSGSSARSNGPQWMAMKR